MQIVKPINKILFALVDDNEPYIFFPTIIDKMAYIDLDRMDNIENNLWQG